MQLKDEFAQLKVELDALQSEQAQQRQNIELRLTDCSVKISRLSALVSDDLRLNPSTTTALVGLGLILNYLSAYFIGPYIQLVPSGVCFILLLVITLTGFALSIKLPLQ
ncbi:hypothetical protein CXF72_11370 [Psychromonas sp. MB-3u-54]|nr:hypothetical protein CXF72_11370 [Psychromonas sp. MB-3u-54]